MLKILTYNIHKGFDRYNRQLVLHRMREPPTALTRLTAMNVVGGALMATMVLDVTFGQFMRQLETVLTLSHCFVGMVKAPVFAYIIAMVGCYGGLRVTGSAESVGKMTTKSVVTSIFLVIIANAIFSVVFSTLRI